MKALIITYYWPPAGGSGVQRWLKFVKYLQDFGIEPIVYTVKDEIYPKQDASLVHEIPEGITILRQPIWNPQNLLFWKKNLKKNSGISNLSNNKVLSFIRGNIFVPDPKIFWVKLSVNFLNTYISENNIDVVISTGPPHSIHLIANQLKQKNAVKWIADFRDPWTNLYYAKEFHQTKFAKNKNRKLEHTVLKNADFVITVSNSLKKEFSKIAENVEVITNGFDDEVLENTRTSLDKKFSISYIGLLPKQSNPKLLFKVLHELINEDHQFKKDIQLNFIGDISDDIHQEIQEYNLESCTSFTGYVSHQKAIEHQQKAQVLLLLIPDVSNNAGILTGKLFEYLTTKRPILAIGPANGDLATILQETNSGTVIDFNNKIALKSEISRLYKCYKENNLVVNFKNIERFHRKKLTEQLSKIIKNL